MALVLAGSDDTWQRVYGARAADYGATIEALAAFDADNPEPMRLLPHIQCGECGAMMHVTPARDYGHGEKLPATYGDVRHADGKYLRREKGDVDGAIETAGLPYFYPISRYGHERSPFNDLARALLTTCVEVTETSTTVHTRIDEGTELQRSLRMRELREELAELEHRQQEIRAELPTMDVES